MLSKSMFAVTKLMNCGDTISRDEVSVDQRKVSIYWELAEN